jgi:hypothetical protein
MVKVKGRLQDGRLIIFLGISERNVELLKQGRPIRVDLADMKVAPDESIGAIALFYGETEGAIVKQLQEGGVITAETIVHTIPKGSTTPS